MGRGGRWKRLNMLEGRRKEPKKKGKLILKLLPNAYLLLN